MTKSNRKKVFVWLTLPHHIPSPEGVRAEAPGRSWSRGLHWLPPGLLSLLSDTAQDPIQGCVPPNPHELGLHSSHCLRKCWTDLPFLWRQFLDWRCFLKWYQLVSLRHKPNRVGNFNCFWRKINLIMCLLCLFSPFQYFWGLSFEDPLLVIVSFFFFGTNTQV